MQGHKKCLTKLAIVGFQRVLHVCSVTSKVVIYLLSCDILCLFVLFSWAVFVLGGAL